MSIELLWIIPIIAVSMFVLLAVLNLQKRNGHGSGGNAALLRREVDEYNQRIVGDRNTPVILAEKRISTIESTIELVSTALSNQQRIIEDFRGKDDTLEKELKNLKERLLELQHEYDITISENYSLRARLNKGEKDGIKNTHVKSGPSSAIDSYYDTDTIEVGKILNISMFDDARKIDPARPSELDDTSEINISKYQN